MSTFVIGDVHGRRRQLRHLIEILPRSAGDTLVLLGDLIDRGEDVPGVVEDVVQLHRDARAAPVVVLRGNHEQMLLDFIDECSALWLHPAVGSEKSFEQYVGHALVTETERDFEGVRREIAGSIPSDHIEFFRQMPLYHEDDYALYVHAGLDHGKHPCETSPAYLLWARDPDFYKHYHGKPCVFGHTPTQLLPLLGRLGRHGIYISHSAIGIDTGYNAASPLSCLQLPDFVLYQTFADGRATTHQMTTLIPAPFRTFQLSAGKR